MPSKRMLTLVRRVGSCLGGRGESSDLSPERCPCNLARPVRLAYRSANRKRRPRRLEAQDIALSRR
jgi:hypothetical protein